MALIDAFIKGEDRGKLDVSTVKRFPYLVWTNVILLIFFIFATYSRYRVDHSKYGFFFLTVMVTSVAFPVSIVLLRLARLRAASILSSQALLANMLWLGVFLPAPGPTFIYRTAAMLMAACVAVLIIALSDRLVFAFSGEAVACWAINVGIALFRSKAEAAELLVDTHAALAVGSILFLCVMAMICLARRHSSSILILAEAEMRRNRDKVEALSGLLRGAESSFQIGHYLKERVDQSALMFADIEKGLDAINAEARELAATAGGCRDANLSVKDFATAMKDAVYDQNSSLDETSASIHQIIATIDSIGKISRDKQGGIKSLVDDLDSKRGRYSSAREGIARIDRASSRVAEALSAIIDISERVNLLAMNASIEAAHLGAAGKGFAVIAMEMRGLSDKTRASAGEIEGSLKENAEAVRGASEVVVGFTNEIEQVNGECRKALDGIDEILNGVQEISIGNREIQEATVSLVDISKKTEASVGGVMTRIDEANGAIGRIDGFARELSEKIEAIDARFKGIRALMEDIDGAGERNMQSISALKSGMESAGRG
jgi:methyl-accepting chemotaxis protein